MVAPVIVYYISGHGFGHARRSAEVIDRLLLLIPELTVHIRTHAAKHIFAELPGERIILSEVMLDVGAIEKSTLEIDFAETMARLRETLNHRDEIVGPEVAFIRETKPALIVADIPFLAGDIAEAACVPCIAISNFTWDWIYEGFPQANSDHASLIGEVRKSYSKMEAILKLPYGGSVESFRRVHEVPLIASRNQHTRADILNKIGISPNDARPRILIAMRGGVSMSAIENASKQLGDCDFFYPQPISHSLPANVITPHRTNAVTFADLLSVSDVVISKLGYGIVADCMASGSRLLWPARTGFREDDVMRAEAWRYLTMREISHKDFFAGNWADTIRALLSVADPPERADTSGADVCARWLDNRIRK